MNFWIVDWQTIDETNGTGTGLAVFLDHLSDYWADCGLKLDPTLFQIDLPFYMESEQWWRPEGESKLCPRLSAARCTYLACLSDRERKLIDWIRSMLDSRVMTSCQGDNSLAKAKARQIHLRSSGLKQISEDSIQSNLGVNPIMVRIAFQDYLIPGQSCFALCDIETGLNMFLNHLKGTGADKVKMDRGDDKFLIIVDPPWENKSVKRKKSYEALGSGKILRTFALLKVICQLLLNHFNRDIRVALWTTEKYKETCFDQLLPTMEMRPDACLLWHKVTNSFESIKVRGNREYLIIASMIGKEPVLEGVLVSKPSAVHSHKPPINLDLPWLQKGTRSDFTQRVVDSLICPGSLSHGKIVDRLKGIELFARYLRPNFFSVGDECIKLQTKDLFL